MMYMRFDRYLVQIPEFKNVKRLYRKVLNVEKNALCTLNSISWRIPDNHRAGGAGL